MSDRSDAYRKVMRQLSDGYYDMDKVFGQGFVDRHPEILGLFLVAVALEEKK